MNSRPPLWHYLYVLVPKPVEVAKVTQDVLLDHALPLAGKAYMYGVAGVMMTLLSGPVVLIYALDALQPKGKCA